MYAKDKKTVAKALKKQISGKKMVTLGFLFLFFNNPLFRTTIREIAVNVTVKYMHTVKPVKFLWVQAGYLTNLCKALVNNLYQAWGDKLNTPILCKMLWRHQDGAKLQGK